MAEPTPRTVRFTENADVSLLRDSVTLQVSSDVLREASPVFGAMLGPNFLERQALYSEGIGSETSIPLPDDDAEAVELLCLFLHPQENPTIPSINPTELLRFASTVDKYACAAAVSIQASALFDGVNMESPDSSFFALQAAYFLDKPIDFARITSKLVREDVFFPTGPIEELTDETEALLMDLFGKRGLRPTATYRN